MKLVYSILGTFNFGGMERVLANKVNYLIAKGFDITIITTDQKGRKPYFDIDPRVHSIDLAINYTDDLSKGLVAKILSYQSKQRKHFLLLKEYLELIKPDIVISMFDNDSSFLYKIKDGSKKVLEIHFSRFKRLQYGRKGILKLIDHYRSSQDLRIVKKYDRFVVLTEEDKNYWGDLGNILVIPNANSFVPKSYSNLDNKKVLAIGRLDYQKGFEDLINSWRIVADSRPDWILNIYGHGILHEQFQEMISDFKLENSIFLHSPTKSIEQIYVNHSLLAMTSRYEGLPMVLLEAQSCGLPLVSYACKCGPKDIITDNGLLVEEGNVEQMAVSLLTLISDDNLRFRMGANSLQNAERFSEEYIMEKWIDLFNSIVH